MCEITYLTKAHEIVSKRTPKPAIRSFQKVHFDIIHLTTAYDGDRYVSHFVDDCTGYHMVVYSFPTKSAVISASDLQGGLGVTVLAPRGANLGTFVKS